MPEIDDVRRDQILPILRMLLNQQLAPTIHDLIDGVAKEWKDKENPPADWEIVKCLAHMTNITGEIEVMDICHEDHFKSQVTRSRTTRLLKRR